MCGFTSGCFGGLVASVFEEGEAWFTTKYPTWPQQSVFYGVFAYYFFSDPHGSMQFYLRPILQQLGGVKCPCSCRVQEAKLLLSW